MTIGTANVQAHPKSCICCKAFPFALKLSNAVKMARTSTAKAGVAAEEAKAALLVEPEDKCVARWAELEDSGLNQEVAKYRKAVICLLYTSPSPRTSSTRRRARWRSRRTGRPTARPRPS